MSGLGEPPQASATDPWVVEQLDKWISAKRQKDFVLADSIRDVLRAMGIDPDIVRPRGWTAEGGCPGGDNNIMQMMPMGQMSGSDDLNPAKRQKTVGMSGLGGGQSSTGNPWTDEKLDKWVIAKRSKDFATADTIRDELRAVGVDPDTMRPRGWSADGGKTGDAWMDSQLDKWLIAKKQRDWATADSIRDELRVLGVDPDTVRPRGWEVLAGGISTGDAWTEQQLDKWLIAKKQKDFVLADQIRDELRTFGVDPDTCRPRKPSSDSGCTGGDKGCGKGSMDNMDNTLNVMENNMMQMMGMMTQMMGVMSQNMANKFCR